MWRCPIAHRRTAVTVMQSRILILIQTQTAKRADSDTRSGIQATAHHCCSASSPTLVSCSWPGLRPDSAVDAKTTRSVSRGEPAKNGIFDLWRALLEVSSFPSLSLAPLLSSLSSVFGSPTSSEVALGSTRKFATAVALRSSVGNPSVAFSPECLNHTDKWGEQCKVSHHAERVSSAPETIKKE